jgi:hypothetical protein
VRFLTINESTLICCEPHLWINLIVDLIASAYLGGEGVISLLVGGLDHLCSEAGVFDEQHTRWPAIPELLAWLKTAKLRGRSETVFPVSRSGTG